MSIGYKDFHSKTEDRFLDLYDFLGIPPVSPPNLIYLAIQKMQSFDFQQEKFAGRENCAEEIQRYLGLVKNQLLDTSHKRQVYEEAWESYYFPSKGDWTDIEKLCARSGESKFLGGRLRKKSWPWTEATEIKDDFNYTRDFLYFVMRDLPHERDVFFLNPHQQVQLSPLQDTIFFQENKFYLKSYGKLTVEVGNDALGKLIAVKDAAHLPLHIGDRIEFANGARLILRSVYGGYRYGNSRPAGPGNENPLAFYFTRENVIIPLQQNKIYILGRNTSDVHHHLTLEENTFCFINIGRRERSISRQNFQVFFHQGNWYIQDLGSRYGTTLDLQGYYRFETLAGGSIMPLDPGWIRLGYDKSYIIEVDTPEKCDKRRKAQQLVIPDAEEGLTVYDIPLL